MAQQDSIQMDPSVQAPDVRMLSVPNSSLSWVLCRADHVKGVFIPLAPLPPPVVKRERLETSAKNECASSESEPGSLSVGPPTTVSPSLVVATQWTEAEDRALQEAVAELGTNRWKLVAKKVNESVYQQDGVRSVTDCTSRWKLVKPSAIQRRSGVGPRGKWSYREDKTMLMLLSSSAGSWVRISEVTGRSVLSARRRYKKLESDAKSRSHLSAKSVEGIASELLRRLKKD